MRYDTEIQKTAWILCRIKPSELEFISESDLALMLDAARIERETAEYKKDARAARMTADIINNLAALIQPSIRDPIVHVLELMPENRGKPIQEGMSPEMFRAWVDQHNAKVNNGDPEPGKDP